MGANANLDQLPKLSRVFCSTSCAKTARPSPHVHTATTFMVPPRPLGRRRKIQDVVESEDDRPIVPGGGVWDDMQCFADPRGSVAVPGHLNGCGRGGHEVNSCWMGGPAPRWAKGWLPWSKGIQSEHLLPLKQPAEPLSGIAFTPAADRPVSRGLDLALGAEPHVVVKIDLSTGLLLVGVGCSEAFLEPFHEPIDFCPPPRHRARPPEEESRPQ